MKINYANLVASVSSHHDDAYFNERYPFVGITNISIKDPFDNVGKWIGFVNSVSEWKSIVDAVVRGDLFWEAKIVHTSSEPEGHAVCIYAPGSKIGDLLGRIRNIPDWKDKSLLWKYDQDTKDRLYGLSSYAFISDGDDFKKNELYSGSVL